jgi:hypothetical protein
MHGEITTPIRLSLTLLENKNKKASRLLACAVPSLNTSPFQKNVPSIFMNLESLIHYDTRMNKNVEHKKVLGQKSTPRCMQLHAEYAFGS